MTASTHSVGPGSPPRSPAPSFEACPKAGSSKRGRNAPFSLGEGESEGENPQRILETLKILDEKAAAAKEQGKTREIADGPRRRDTQAAPIYETCAAISRESCRNPKDRIS